MAIQELLKVGLASIKEEHLLVVRKRGTASFILPGGKPEGHEDDLTALKRELQEELGCGVVGATFQGAFTDQAADLVNTVVTVRLYAGHLRGTPRPASEIEEMAWVSLWGPKLPLAPSLTNQILPHLCAHLNGSATVAKRRRTSTTRSGGPVHA
jgi:8-oxo-dGTP diphosphatase